ncbi:hypothetical protein U1Q18_013641 [Sarracenia purpurea var. burkii]
MESIELSLDLPLSEPRSPQDLRPRFVISAPWEKNPAAQGQSSVVPWPRSFAKTRTQSCSRTLTCKGVIPRPIPITDPATATNLIQIGEQNEGRETEFRREKGRSSHTRRRYRTTSPSITSTPYLSPWSATARHGPARPADSSNPFLRNLARSKARLPSPTF